MSHVNLTFKIYKQIKKSKISLIDLISNFLFGNIQISGYDPPPHYGYIQENCDYTPVEECKKVERCENIPEERCKPVTREDCEKVKMQQCQIKYSRKCTNEPTEVCRPTYKKSCQSVHKGDDCHYTKPRKMCRTLEREVTKYKRQRPLCIWPRFPESTQCEP